MITNEITIEKCSNETHCKGPQNTENIIKNNDSVTIEKHAKDGDVLCGHQRL